MAYFYSTASTEWANTSSTAWEAGSVFIWSNLLRSQHSLSAAVAASFGVIARPLQAAEQLRGDVAVNFLISAHALQTAEQLFGKIGGTIFYQNSVWGVSSADYVTVLGIDKINISRIM